MTAFELIASTPKEALLSKLKEHENHHTSYGPAGSLNAQKCREAAALITSDINLLRPAPPSIYQAAYRAAVALSSLTSAEAADLFAETYP